MTPQTTTARAADQAVPATDARAAWERIASGYDENVTPTHFWLGGEGLRRAGLRPGMFFLDVAAGSGALSIPAARLGARVLATDHSPAMLELLARRARKEGLAIETRVMDGHALELDDGSFDLAGSQFGVMLFPDMPRGIREMTRVTKPGGRVLVNAFGDFRKIEFFGCFVAAIQAVRPGFSGPAKPPLPFQLQDPKRLHDEFAKAGLTDIKVETIVETLPPATGERLWRWLVWSNPVVEGVLGELGITDAERTQVQQALDRLVRQRAGGGDAASLTNPVNIGVATK
jgi:ubiquinone/menaquinone biosynthesis C-methylase UbiE